MGVVVVLGSLEGETQFWPKLKEDNTYTTVSGDKWSENSLYVNTWKTNRINDNTLQEHSIQVHSYDEHVTDTIALVHYPHWPVNGKTVHQYHRYMYVLLCVSCLKCTIAMVRQWIRYY